MCIKLFFFLFLWIFVFYSLSLSLSFLASLVGAANRYENVDVDGAGLALATGGAFSGAAPYGAGMRVSAVLGCLGVVAPRALLGKGLDPSQLCDLLAPGSGSAACFFVPALTGPEEAAAALASLASSLAGPPERGCVEPLASTELALDARYADGKRCLARPALDRAAGDESGGNLLEALEPSSAEVAAAVASLVASGALGSKARDPYLKGDGLRSRVDALHFDPATGRVRPKEPVDPAECSKDVRVYGAKVLERQVNTRTTVLRGTASSVSGAAPSTFLGAAAVVTTELDHVDPTVNAAALSLVYTKHKSIDTYLDGRSTPNLTHILRMVLRPHHSVHPGAKLRPVPRRTLGERAGRGPLGAPHRGAPPPGLCQR